MSADIYIPFDRFTEIGGPSTFMKNLKSYLDNIGFDYINSSENAGMIFFPINFDIGALDSLKARKGKIIQRLDGIYYPEKHGGAYLEMNREIKNVYQNYSDFVVFQSEYSRAQCFEMLGGKNENDYEIIVNGVDNSIFFPDGNHKREEKVRFVTSGSFRNMDMIEPITKALDKLKGSFDFELTVIGPIRDEGLKKYLHRDYIKHVGGMSLQEVAEILRKSDVFIYSHLNPPCPNSVLEAISCGLPAVGFKSGAMEELLPFSNELLAEVSNNIFQRYEEFDSSKLAEKIRLSVEKYDKYKETAMKNSGLYSFEVCGSKYIRVFEKMAAKESGLKKLLNKFSGKRD